MSGDAPSAPRAYRARFDCLWCGTAWTTRGEDDLEGWAQLCPDCLGKAGANPFLRGRLRAALAARAGSPAAGRSAAGRPADGPRPELGPRPPRAPAPRLRAFPDDWFLRRGPYERGAIHDTAWHAELDVVTRWLDGLPLSGRIAEPAAGVGFFSPLLAGKGELHAADADSAALDQARDRLVAHRLRAHLHVEDPFSTTPPPARPGTGTAGQVDRPADAIVAAFLLGRVRGAGLDAVANALRDRLRAGGRLALVELEPDPAGGPPAGIPWTWHDPDLVDAALRRARFKRLERASTGRFFRLLAAEAA